ncbi:MAG: hypothetical protein SGI73_01995 [Chloroflexota bacterium]|nr:hypothetical protein [Chloroflexota bacterium]
MNIWQFSSLVSQRLLSWNIINLLVGVALVRRGRRGVGSQFAGWALINIAIALFGDRATQARAQKPDAISPLIREGQATNLRRLLWINAGLDLLYMLGGALFAARAKTKQRRGMGIGIIIQGAFLFIFDVLHAPQVPER